MSRLSVIILTLNEEHNIADCLDSVHWADEVIVVDSGSSDRTLALARARGALVLEVPWEGYGATRNIGLERATGEWILWLDADERVTPGLSMEIQDIIKQENSAYLAFRVSRRAYFLGRWIKHSGWYPSQVTRLFRKSSGKFSETLVHEHLIVHGSVGRLDNDIVHFTDPNLNHYFDKFNRYTSLGAEEMFKANRRFRWIDILVRPPFTFCRMFVLKLGFRDGIEGFILAVSSSAYVFVKYAKLWELCHNELRKGVK